jgi:uncharacterized protein (UPF0248 family)
MIIIKSNFPRDVLNEIKWKGLDLNLIKIDYISRGAPNDTSSIQGKDIVGIDSFYIEIHKIPYNSFIPYHRIKKITYDKQEIFSRK